MNITESLTLKSLVEQFIEDLDDGGAAPATIRLYDRSLRQILRHGLEIADFDKDGLIEKVAALSPTGWQRSTLTAHLIRVATFGNWLCRSRITTRRHHPPEHSRKPKFRDLPTDDEIDLLLRSLAERAARATPGRARTRAQDELIVRVLLATGARRSEALDLTVDDLIIDEHPRLIIRGTKSAAAERAVEISAALARQLKSYRARWHIARGRFFRSKTRRPLDGNEFGKWLKQYCVELGIKCIVTPHVFRHRWILEQIIAGKSALEVMTRIGHQDVEMTVYYFNQVRRLMPWVEVAGDIALLERKRNFWKRAMGQRR